MQPIEQGACLVDATTQYHVIEEGRIACLYVRMVLRLKVVKEFLTGSDLPIDQVSGLLRDETQYKIELDEEEDANLAWAHNGFREPSCAPVV